MDQNSSRKSNFWRYILDEENSSLPEDTFAKEENREGSFNPSGFFIPGWKGDGLISPSAIAIKNSINNLTIDGLALFKKSCSSSKSMKQQSYNEFLKYAEFNKLDLSLVAQQNDFWLHLQDESSPLKKHLDNFIKIYCFRAVSIYLFRIKFIMDLSKEINITVSEDNLFNPLSFLGKIFKKNSSTELNCESLQINEYSWYRPSSEYKDSLIKIKEAFENVTLTEIIKIISTPKDDQLSSKSNYSHSVSHRSFGLFLNELLIKFPTWLKPEGKTKNYSQQKVCILPKTINTRFAGNLVTSMALSHWLAQESNVKISQWNNLICPEFEGTEFVDGQFLKICQELQFLSFLTRVAVEHKYEVIPFICKIMRDKYRTNIDEMTEQQGSFLNLDTGVNETLFNRIVLNLIDLPKNNPHHFIVQQILSQKLSLKKDGIIILLTNQKIFVPSHSDRVELLLKEFKMEASFNLEELKGKGEIPNYFYILSKRQIEKQINKHLFEFNSSPKESCLTFELKGNLSQFNKFSLFVDELRHFTNHKNAITTPIYAQEIGPDQYFEFHQDAIIEGKLISSVATKDIGHIPHPKFFNNLMKACISLESFFHIEMLAVDEMYGAKKNLATELLGFKLGAEKQFPLLLIINQSEPLNVRIELTTSESFRAKVEMYGTVHYHYFGLNPKKPSLNLNVFREFFNSNIGHQVIQLHLSDGPTKLKAKLKSLLIPAFFANTQFMPQSLQAQFRVLEFDVAQIKESHPDSLKEEFSKINILINQLAPDYPWHLLGLLANFKIQLKESYDENESSKGASVIFSNPLISSELVKLRTSPIYPNHPDVFIDYKIKTHQELHLPLTSVSLKLEDDHSILMFKHLDQDIIGFHAHEVMNHFLKFILQNANGVKIADILMNLKIPALSELIRITDNSKKISLAKEALLKQTEELIAELIRNQISQP